MKGAIMIRQARHNLKASLMLLAWTVCGTATASQLLYYPNNPSFGGNPANGAVLMNMAQSQNKYADNPDLGASGAAAAETPLQQLNDMLNRSVESQVASAISSQIIGSDGTLHPGTIQTSDFVISVANIPNTGQLLVTTTDKSTGAQTSVTIGAQGGLQ